MKSIPLLLLNDLQKPGRDTCFLVKMVSKQDKTAYAFTSGDTAMKVNDGSHDLWYVPTNVLVPQNMQATLDMEVDNTELHGWFDDLVATAFGAGLLGGAEVTIYRVNYLKPQHGLEVVNFGVVGRMELAAGVQGARKIEFKGLDYLLTTKKNPLYSLTCRNDYGDERCGKTFVWDPGSIDSVASQYLLVKLTGIAAAPGFYNFGVVRFTSGDNNGVELEVEEWLPDGYMRLSYVTPYPMQPGDTLMLRDDCDKFAATCIAKANILNFNGEHLTPVQDQSLMVPGAYIKTDNAL